VIRRGDDTVYKKRVNFCVLKYLVTKKIATESRKCCFRHATNVTFSKFRGRFFETAGFKEGLGFVKQTCKFSEIQITKRIIEFDFVETIKLVRSNSNVILTRQAFSHRSGRVAGSKHRALAFYFSVQICDMFFISICKGMLDLGVCMTSVLAKRMQPHSTDF